MMTHPPLTHSTGRWRRACRPCSTSLVDELPGVISSSRSQHQWLVRKGAQRNTPKPRRCSERL